MNISKYTKIVIIIILLLAFLIRVYKLDTVPPSISWDEAAVGFNALSIASSGRDEYGSFFPLYFKSFGDDKHPVHIYSAALAIKILGLSEFSVRLPSVIFGTLNVFLIFLICLLLFKNNLLGLIAAFFLAISPQNIHFSRFSHEANFALFFYMLGLTLFYIGLNKKNILIPLSVFSFLVSFFSYHPSKLLVPATLIFLFVFYFKFLTKKNILTSLFVLILVVFVIVLNPALLGAARIKQNSIAGDKSILQKVAVYAKQYSWHFSLDYLFISGDKNPRLSSQSTGEFYKIDAFFLILGFIYLLYKRSKVSFLVLFWAFLAPIPSALAAEAPHAARSLFMMGSWHIISASGFYFILSFTKNKIFKSTLFLTVFLVLSYFLFIYLNYYFGEYSRRYAIEWQYGMKQIAQFVKEHPEYSSVITTDVRSQPYIFYLFYLKPDLTDYLSSVIYNNNMSSRSYNNVASFDKYAFGGWDPVESVPIKGTLYVLSPSEYDGLKYKSKFDIKKMITYPDNSVAFYIVTAI